MGPNKTSYMLNISKLNKNRDSFSNLHVDMKVLFLTFDGLTDPLGQSQIIPYMAGLSKKGHAITILSVEKKDNFRKNKAAVESILAGAGIQWERLLYSRKIPFVSQRSTLRRVKAAAERIVKEEKIETLHCRSYLSALIGLQFKRKYGTKFIFDMRGFWADERVDGAIWKMSNPVHKTAYAYFKRKEIAFLKNADYVISLTENARNEFMSWEALQGEKIPVQVIPCCADLGHFSKEKIRPVDIEKLRSYLHIGAEEFVISYLGSLGTWYMLEEMLDFFKELLHEKSHAKFLVISPDDDALVKELCAKKNIPEERIIVKSAARKDVPLFLSLSAASLYFIKPAYSKKASSPTKTGEILAMGIPVITNAGIGDSDKIIEASGAGLLVKEFTTAAYRKAVAGLDAVLKAPSENYKNIARQYFSLEKGVELYHDVYNKITNL